MASIELIDGNNIAIRAATSFNIHDRTAMNLRMRYNSTRANQIFIWDGANHNQRRQSIYPIYKTNRTPLAEDIYTQIRLWRQLLTFSPAVQIEVPLWEADDVIATLARKFAARGVEVVVRSNDEDYMQLTANPLITINGVQNPKAEGRWIPLYKACVGDSSDNIKGIPGFGKKTWADVIGQYELQHLETAIVRGSPHAFESLTLPKAVKSWLMVADNLETVQNMLQIVHFYTVPDADIDAGITPGHYQPDKAEEIFRKYIL